MQGLLKSPGAASRGSVQRCSSAGHPAVGRRKIVQLKQSVGSYPAANGTRLHASAGEAVPKSKGSKRPGRPDAGHSSGGSGSAAPGRHREPRVEDLDDEDEEEEAFLAPFMNSVVKVYCVHTEPNFSLPWQRKRQYTSSSSGFIVATGQQRWLLTNAHSVDYHTQVKVKKRGDDQRYLARVLSVGVDCDVALLTVDDDKFWEGVTPLSFGPLPKLQDDVAVVGYPIGGDTISVTVGVVSRIEVTEYTHGSTDLLGVQIDAAINGGNSGGPVFNRRGQCVGIAFQALSGDDVENVGYVIPAPVVNHFLIDYQRTGGFTGFPAMGIQWQRMESLALRRAHKMADGQKGVLIRKVNPTSPAAAQLRAGDVLLSFDGVDISCDGTVPFRTGERIAYSYLISQKYVGDEAALRVLREGQELELSIKLSKPMQLVPPHLGNRDPSYFLVSGLVFTACNAPYLQSEYGEEWAADAPVKLLEKMYHQMPSQPDEQVVLLSQVLASNATLGYEDKFNVQVVRFNGTPVRNLQHLATMVAGCTEPFMCFDDGYGETIIVSRQEALADTPEVLAAHGIPADMSPDLRALIPDWPPRGATAEAGAEAAVAA